MMTDRWEIYMSKSQTLVRVNEGIAEEAPMDGASTIMEVNMKPQSVKIRYFIC